MTNNRGRKNPGYQQSRDHVRLVEEKGYALKTFPMEYSDARKSEDGIGPATIGGFTPKLSDRTITKIGNAWYASDNADDVQLAEEIETPERYPEGARTTISINAFERSSKAREGMYSASWTKLYGLRLQLQKLIRASRGGLHSCTPPYSNRIGGRRISSESCQRLDACVSELPCDDSSGQSTSDASNN